MLAPNSILRKQYTMNCLFWQHNYASFFINSLNRHYLLDIRLGNASGHFLSKTTPQMSKSVATKSLPELRHIPNADFVLPAAEDPRLDNKIDQWVDKSKEL